MIPTVQLFHEINQIEKFFSHITVIPQAPTLLFRRSRESGW